MIQRLPTSLLTIVVSQAQRSAVLVDAPCARCDSQWAGASGRAPSRNAVHAPGLVLPHRNQAELDAFLKELYDPSSPSYRQFLTVEEFTAGLVPARRIMTP
jgi:hypothetical protein